MQLLLQGADVNQPKKPDILQKPCYKAPNQQKRDRNYDT